MHAIIAERMGVDGCWCAPRSSKPLQVVRSCPGGFDSHILSPTGTGAAALLRFLCISTPQSNLWFASSPAGEPFGIVQAPPKSCPRLRGKCRGASRDERGMARSRSVMRYSPSVSLRSTAPPRAVAPFGCIVPNSRFTFPHRFDIIPCYGIYPA